MTCSTLFSRVDSSSPHCLVTYSATVVQGVRVYPVERYFDPFLFRRLSLFAGCFYPDDLFRHVPLELLFRCPPLCRHYLPGSILRKSILTLSRSSCSLNPRLRTSSSISFMCRAPQGMTTVS